VSFAGFTGAEVAGTFASGGEVTDVGELAMCIVDFGAGFGAAGPKETSPEPIGFGGDDRIFSGFAWNFARQLGLQKKYCLPLCIVR
jgi:hypothetical protein